MAAGCGKAVPVAISTWACWGYAPGRAAVWEVTGQMCLSCPTLDIGALWGAVVRFCGHEWASQRAIDAPCPLRVKNKITYVLLEIQ